jgi:hypothetical protein
VLSHTKRLRPGFQRTAVSGATLGGELLGQRDAYRHTPMSSSHNDGSLRITETDHPDGGQETFAYNLPASNLVGTTKLSSARNLVQTALLDGLGRVVQSQLNSDPDGMDFSDTGYDRLGRPRPDMGKPITTMTRCWHPRRHRAPRRDSRRHRYLSRHVVGSRPGRLLYAFRRSSR